MTIIGREVIYVSMIYWGVIATLLQRLLGMQRGAAALLALHKAIDEMAAPTAL